MYLNLYSMTYMCQVMPDKIEKDEWTEAQIKKLIMLHKKNLPESALLNTFKKAKIKVRENFRDLKSKIMSSSKLRHILTKTLIKAVFNVKKIMA